MQKTRKITITETKTFCNTCNSEITAHFGSTLGRCDTCKKDICPRCTGVYTVKVSKFKGNSGDTLPYLEKILCLDCGLRFESKLLITLGLRHKVGKENT